MKTALLYCGEARTIAQTFENHRWYLRGLPNPDVFVSVADNKEADDMLLLQEAFPKARFEMEKVVQRDIDESPFVERTQFRSAYPRSTSKQGVLKQLWAWDTAWGFFCGWGGPADYDLVVRVRPDIAFCRLDVPDLAFAPRDPDLCLVPWWAKWGGCNDRFAILGGNAAKAYFTTYQKLPALWSAGAPLHPEQLLRASLEMDGITPDDSLTAEFITIRMASPENPKGGYFPCDPSIIDISDRARHSLL